MFGLLKQKLLRVVHSFKKLAEQKLDEGKLRPRLEELKLELLEADVAYEVAEQLIGQLKECLLGKTVPRGKEEEEIVRALKESLERVLSVPQLSLTEIVCKAKAKGKPAVFVFFGFNGVGKSLTIAKVSKWLAERGFKPVLAAGDTFRAAGIEQLEAYAQAVGVPVIKQKQGADPCAVVYDCVSFAKRNGYDVVLADTAGRSHTNRNLMDELAKICRINRPDLKILVLDSLTGSDVLKQLELFDAAVRVDALIFSKLDLNEKGGNLLSACYFGRKPILFVGTGQGYEQLETYEPSKILNKLLWS